MKRLSVALLVTLLLILTLAVPVNARPEPAGPLSWIVAFEEGINFPAKQKIIENAGGVLEMELEALNMAIVWLPEQAGVRGLSKQKGVRWVEEESYRYLELQPLPWGINRIDAEYVWAAGNTGDGVNVAVLDTGIDTNHPDLAANLEGRYSAVNKNTNNVEDANGHGTHVAGVIAALNNEIGVVGVGPRIDLYAVQITKGSRISLTNILKGINWSIGTLGDSNPNNNIQVMSMSFGGGYSQSEDSALQTAYNRGIVLVASAGNDYGGAVSYPAALPQVIAVSATDSSDHIASFSSTGAEVELAAPGMGIYSTYKGDTYATMSGTSMAAPHVSGVVALVIASGIITDVNGQYGVADEVRARLQAMTTDLGAPGRDNLFGFGLVDAEKAVLGTTSGNN